MERATAKKVLKVALMIYLASFLIINWNDVSWIFNYKEVGGLVSDFFNPYPTIQASSIDEYFYPNHSVNTTTTVANIKTNYTEKQNTIEIPKIAISVPIVFSTSVDKNALAKDLDLGVVEILLFSSFSCERDFVLLPLLILI